MEKSFLFQAIVYLASAVIGVNIAKRLGLGTVLGYLLAGVVIGPFVLGFVGEEGKDIMHVSEFGVVMMLFVIGLELEPNLLWRMRRLVIGLGGMQVFCTTIAISFAAYFLGQSWQAALAIGATLSLSSTAIVMQTLSEKGLLKTSAGNSSFAVLLSQDIAVIPLLAIFPILATEVIHQESTSLISSFSGWQQTLIVLGAIAIIIVAGRYIVSPVFRWVAKTRQRELFMATALLLVFLIAELMIVVGLSPALGTFLAGVVLANSEFKHELESDIDPFKGLLLGLFFISVGSTIDFGLVRDNFLIVIALVLGLMFLKGVILYVLGKSFGLKGDQNMLFAVSLAQMGEFAFVLFSFAGQYALINAEDIDLLIAIVALSMALTPLFFVANERLILPRYFTKEKSSRTADEIHDKNPVIIAGFGRYGNIVGRFLRANGVSATVLDNDSDRVELLRRFGYKVYYGDASRFDLMKAAGAETAKIIIIAMDTPQQCLEMVAMVKKNFPHLKILSRAYDRNDSFDLMESGVDYIYRETLDSSLRLGADALQMIGFRAYQTHRAARTFLKHDERVLSDLIKHRHDSKSYISVAKEKITELEELILRDIKDEGILERDSGWDSEKLRIDAKS
ncbi:monovalent cation:proton antiporter-2 (CPA2) family protein [Pedobacter glucosidilyticus]|uniref:monovalent cation:proton antiporter-2 (CPA2) family protein n=1 Tax=Pedobacter glucosidilyticus TaxID=1122941 RepID=UPI0026ED22AA|nr:monovalent cation:proton antiporter-2 (CPA2) family protein [Pedobacter glucosidilyticus]